MPCPPDLLSSIEFTSLSDGGHICLGVARYDIAAMGRMSLQFRPETTLGTDGCTVWAESDAYGGAPKEASNIPHPQALALLYRGLRKVARGGACRSALPTGYGLRATEPLGGASALEQVRAEPRHDPLESLDLVMLLLHGTTTKLQLLGADECTTLAAAEAVGQLATQEGTRHWRWSPLTRMSRHARWQSTGGAAVVLPSRTRARPWTTTPSRSA